MKKKHIAAIIAAAVFITGGVLIFNIRNSTKTNESGQLTAKQKVEDFDYAYNLLKENYPMFEVEKKKTGYDWLAHKKAFEEEIKGTKNDVEFFNKMDEILMRIQDEGTGMVGAHYLDSIISGNNMVTWANVLYDEKVRNVYEKLKNKTKDQSKSSIIGNSIDPIRGQIINPSREQRNNICYMPILTRYIEGKYVVIEMPENISTEYGITKGSIIEKVNNKKVDDYIKGRMNKEYLRYDINRNKLYSNCLVVTGDKNEEVSLELKTPEGQAVIKKLKLQELTYDEFTSGFIFQQQNVYTKVIEDNKIGYLNINTIDENLDDATKINDFLYQIRNYQYLIIDIRQDFGVNEKLWEKYVVPYFAKGNITINNYSLFTGGKYIKPFLNEEIKNGEGLDIPIELLPKGKNYPAGIKDKFKGVIVSNHVIKGDSNFKFKGKVYLLVNDQGGVDVGQLEQAAKETQAVTLVGTTCSGNEFNIPPAVAKLPNSNFIFKFSPVMNLNYDGTPKEESHIKPDILIEQKSSDIINYLKWKKSNGDGINPYDTQLNKLIEILRG